jgi:SMC interacting uncharacterized protein involved in chromosome segregation
MPEQRIQALQEQLLTSNEAVARLTRENTVLTTRLSDAESRAKKLKRTARREATAQKEELTIAQNRRS